MKNRHLVIAILTVTIGFTGMCLDRIAAHATKRFNVMGTKAGTEVAKTDRIKEKAKHHRRFEVLLEDIYQRNQLKDDFGGSADLGFDGNALPGDPQAQSSGLPHSGCLWVAADGSAEYSDIQTAVNAAYAGESICVVKGTYKGKKDFVLTWKNKDLRILGGFSAVGSVRDAMGESVIDGEGQRRCVLAKKLSSESEFSGFTLTHCDASREPKRFGRGSAMMNIDSHLKISDVVFKENKTKEFAAALYNFRSNVGIIRSTFEDNHNRLGAAVINVQSDVVVDKAVFKNNTSDKKVSALFNMGGGLKMTNSIFFNNKAGSADSMRSASAVFLLNTLAKISNVTFYGNGLSNPNSKGSAIVISSIKDVPAAEITNCILRDGGNEIVKAVSKGADPVVRYSNVQGGFPGVGNIDQDPLFKDPANGDFSLLAGSPSVDSGALEGSPADDFLGVPRPMGNAVDMGAYELVSLNEKAAVSISAGGLHNCALLKDGTVHCWGSNEDADGNPSGQGEGFVLSNPALKIVKVTSGMEFNCVLISDGTVQCWGVNDFEQLNFTNPFSSEVVDIDSGAFHTCAILENGFVTCWGSNFDEYSNFSGQSINYGPEDPNAKALKIASGGYHSCALLDNGQVHCWGSNLDILPAVTNQAEDYQPADPNTRVTDISAGHFHSCALLSNGSVHCWGSNLDASSLRISNQSQDYIPSDPSLAAVKVASGGYHNCALLANGTTHCWGWNKLGQSDIYTPSNPAAKIIGMDGGYAHSCFALSTGSIECEGWNAFGQANSYNP